jgi:hypothetical protein
MKLRTKRSLNRLYWMGDLGRSRKVFRQTADKSLDGQAGWMKALPPQVFGLASNLLRISGKHPREHGSLEKSSD